jgi:hypothetical protein
MKQYAEAMVCAASSLSYLGETPDSRLRTLDVRESRSLRRPVTAQKPVGGLPDRGPGNPAPMRLILGAACQKWWSRLARPEDFGSQGPAVRGVDGVRFPTGESGTFRCPTTGA